MSDPANTPNALDEMLDRLSHASSQIVKAVEDQTRQIDEWTKDFLDRSEAATERLLKRFEQQSHAQIDALRREVAQLERRIGGLRSTAPAKKATAKKTAAKKTAAKKTAANKTAANKTAANKTAATKATARKSGLT
jgi:mevalonate kinase